MGTVRAGTKRIRANKYLFFIDAWMDVLRAFQAGETTVKFMMEEVGGGCSPFEFEIRITKIGGMPVGSRAWKHAMTLVHDKAKS